MSKQLIQPRPKKEELKGVNVKIPVSLATMLEVYASDEYTGMSKSEVFTQLFTLAVESDPDFTKLMKQRASKPQSTTTVPEQTSAPQKKSVAA